MDNTSLITDILFFSSDDESSAAVALADGNVLSSNDTDPNLSTSGKGKLLSDFVRYMFEVVVYTCFSGGISLFGIVTNIINILVFRRQGLMKESVNVTLAGLATADLCCLITMLWLSISYAIILSKPRNLNFDPLSVLYITGGWPHVMFTRVTCWITAFVAFERCICVVLPFKVKEIITPRRALFVVIFIFIFIISCYIPIFYTHQLRWTRNSATNRTILTLYFTPNKVKIEHICHFINDVIFPTASLMIVMVCTRITVGRINSSSEWRNTLVSANIKATRSVSAISSDVSSENPSDSNEKSEIVKTPELNRQQKERKIIRMVTLICTIFLICNTPCILIIYLRFAVPEIANLGRYHNLFHVLYSLDFLLENINSTVNILVYYRMSSRYKAEFRAMFGLRSN